MWDIFRFCDERSDCFEDCQCKGGGTATMRALNIDGSNRILYGNSIIEGLKARAMSEWTTRYPLQ
jgi:hypothetical protein